MSEALMLLGVHLYNYRIFADASAGILPEDLSCLPMNSDSAMKAGVMPVTPLSNLMAIIGRNASGKSLFFNALEFAADCVQYGCADASTMRGRQGYVSLVRHADQPIGFRLLFKANLSEPSTYLSYCFELTADAHGRPRYKKEKACVYVFDDLGEKKETCLLDVADGKGKVAVNGQEQSVKVADRKASVLKAYGSVVFTNHLTTIYYTLTHWFFCRFSVNGERADIPVPPGGQKHLNPYGTNVQNVLEYLQKEDPKRYKRVIERIEQKIPQLRKFHDQLPDVLKDSPNKLFLYLLLLEDIKPRPMICIETPDKDLYHDMVDILAAEFRTYALDHPSSQIMFTTHNPHILESMSPNEVWMFQREDKNGDPEVHIRCIGEDPLVNEMYREGVGMGAIWYSGHFDDASY